METFSLKKIAAIIAELDSRDPVTLHAQLRNPLVKALLQPIANDRGRGSAAKFEPRELIRARLLLGLFDIGLTSKELANVNEALSETSARQLQGTVRGAVTSPESAKIDGQIVYHGEVLNTLIRGARADENWDIQIRFTRTSSGERRVSPWVKWSEWEQDRVTGDLIDLQRNETHLGTLTVPASSLIRPLIKKFY